MVVIHMKSTADKDEWLYETTCAKETTPLIEELAFLHNARVRLRSQTMALWNLVNEDKGAHLKNRGEGAGAVLDGLYEKAKRVTSLDNISGRVYCTREEVVRVIEEITKTTIQIFEKECSPEDAIAKLWATRDDPDVTEEERLMAWYLLELTDPQFKERDFIPLEKAKLWWAGKEIKKDDTLSTFVGRNEKSKIVGKLTSEATGCPSREPKLSYEEQRKLRDHFTQKRNEFKELEASELADHKNVTRKPSDFVRFRAPTSEGTSLFGDGARATVDPHAKAGGEGLIQLNTNVRPIHHKSKSEHEVS
eukprot:TRINITY_DN6966_c0_g1_i1.p1 TRINITY_DN6966_c0_g1~~TRINITY_DN6966_c0_g1_i1.p1  ORF type:complete len:325 (+),score=79.83 TRINITY_DN6966_c0_g1_i1:60-977(+)